MLRVLLAVVLLLGVALPRVADAVLLCRNNKGAIRVREVCKARERQLDLGGLGVSGPSGPPGPPGEAAAVTRAAVNDVLHGERPTLLDVPGVGRLVVQTCSTLPGNTGVALGWTNTSSIDQDLWIYRVAPGGTTSETAVSVALPASPVATPDVFFNEAGIEPAHWVLQVSPRGGGTQVTLTGFHEVKTAIACRISVQALITPAP